MTRNCHRKGVMGLLACSVCLIGFFATRPVRADDVSSTPDERFAGEPQRPKARTPIRFVESFAQARAEAGRSHRPILAYFTGRHCGWCRAMEQRTLTDAEVVELSKEFVCVKLDSEKEPQLYDALAVDAIPRSFVLTAEGTRVDMVPGYRPAAEYAGWLRMSHVRPLADRRNKEHRVPAAVGAAEGKADLLVWFVDGERTIKRWTDPKAFDHPQLLQILRISGFSARVEHLAFSDFPARWDRAAAAGRLPDLIASEKLPASARDLERRGRLLGVVSQRLASMPGLASCPDFADRSLHMLQGGPNESAARRAVGEILKPGPETDPPGPRLSDAADPLGAEQSARRAVAAYMLGDPRVLKEVASEDSPQLARCTKANAWQRGMEVDIGPVEIRGGMDLALAKVEMTFRAKEVIGADPWLVVLRQESSRWKAFAVCNDAETLRDLPETFSLIRPRADAAAPVTPRLVWPADQAVLRDSKRPLTWEVPDGGEAIVAQVCQLMSEGPGADTRGESWPYTALIAVQPVRRGGSVPSGRFVTGMPVRWCVWSIGVGGRMAVSEVRSYDFADHEDATKKEYARFEGVWRFALVEVEGTKQPEAPFETNKIIIWGDGHFVVVQGQRITRGHFELDLTKTPRHFDFTVTDGPAKGQRTSAIYDLEGDTYRFCGSIRSKERPTALISKPGSGTILQVLKREKQTVKHARIEVGRQELTGTWQAVSYALDGNKATDDDMKKIRLSIDADGTATAVRDGKVFIAGTTKIDPTMDPMTIDVTYTEGDIKGQTALGIYKIEDDLLTICRTAPQAPRPTEFASAPGSGRTLMTYKRVKTSTK